MESGEGLMAFYAEFEPDDVERLRQWHNCEHMAERVAIEGFLRGARYRAIDTPARFLMMYETTSAAVLGSAPYHAALNAPSDWTRQALTWFREPARAIYSKVSETGSPAWRTAPYALTARFNCDDGGERVVDALRLPQAVGDGSLQRFRLYAVDEEISGMMTSERQIYSGGPGAQQWLAFAEMMTPFDDTPGLPDADAFVAAGARDLYLDRLAIDFALEAAR